MTTTTTTTTTGIAYDPVEVDRLVAAMLARHHGATTTTTAPLPSDSRRVRYSRRPARNRHMIQEVTG